MLLPLAILAGGWFFTRDKNSDSATLPPMETAGVTDRQSSENTPEKNPLAPTIDEQIAPKVTTPSVKETTSFQQLESTSSELNSYGGDNDGDNEVDVSSVAVEPLSDPEFIQLERLMKTDKALRLNILEEFRYNTDPTRAKQLAALLGPYNDAEIVQTASELAFSGDPQSQRAGLDLLSRIQPHSNEARDVAIDLLSSENDPVLLVATMNVLATPTRAATNNQRQLLSDNLHNLAFHQDARVRSQSMSLLGRWDKNSATSVDTLTRGLTDPDPAVRSSATFALSNVISPNEVMIIGLLNIAEDTSEKKSTRYAALDALKNIPLTGTSLRRYNSAKINVNKRVLSTTNNN